MIRARIGASIGARETNQTRRRRQHNQFCVFPWLFCLLLFVLSPSPVVFCILFSVCFGILLLVLSPHDDDDDDDDDDEK